MFVTLRKNKLHFIILLVLSVLCGSSSSYAGPPPPGAPKKNDCKAALTVTTIQDINFGQLNANTGGIVTIGTDGSRIASGGVILAGGTTAAAVFELSSSLAGCEVYPIIIRPSNNTTLTEPIGNTMLASNFVTLPATGFTLIPGIPQLISVGADLTLAAAQAGGTYVTLAPYSIIFRQ